MHAFDCMHAFVCMHVSCITGVVYIFDDSKALFGGETVFANNTAEFGGTAVTCTTRFYEYQVTMNKTSPARGYSGRAASKKTTSRSSPPLGRRTCV